MRDRRGMPHLAHGIADPFAAHFVGMNDQYFFHIKPLDQNNILPINILHFQ
jgi:hypothetical protein